MGLSRRRMLAGATAGALTASIATAIPLSAAGAPQRSGAVPLTGNWEGVGSHGLPLSFALARRHGRLVATSIALGAPLTCPAEERDAEAVPLSRVSYAGPGTGGNASRQAMLSGQAEHGDPAYITGRFATRSSGTFSVQVKGRVGCGWPSGTLRWRVHRARRVRVLDGTWTAPLSGPTVVDGAVTVAVKGHGRVVQSFRSSFTCRTASAVGTDRFATAPAYEFIRPDGSFYSPLRGNELKRHRTIWSGRFTQAGAFNGTLRIYDSCTGQLVNAAFSAAVESRHGS